MNDDKRVSLGCGTLILIALIVLIFGNQNRNVENAKVDDELRKLQRQISVLRDTIDEQTQEIASLRRAITELSQRE